MINHTYGRQLLKLDHVSLVYDGVEILRDINKTVSEIDREGSKGQVVGLLAPSGFGKTQLFRIMAGLNKPTSGGAYVDGKTEPVKAGEVGVVAQGYPLFNHRTLWSNLMVAVKAEDKKNAKDKVEEYLEEFELQDKRHLYPAQLSGGQRQRVAIIQQLLCSDHFLLMDEPFSGLDMIMLEKSCEEIQRVANRDEKNTVFVVSHDITAAASVADHLWLLGRERDETGAVIPGTRIVQTYDLIERGLCWEPGIVTQPAFMEFVAEVKNRFRTL